MYELLFACENIRTSEETLPGSIGRNYENPTVVQLIYRVMRYIAFQETEFTFPRGHTRESEFSFNKDIMGITAL